jgi:DNA-binding transcriptional LysR family regulator
MANGGALDSRLLEIFLAVSDAQSMTAAAKRLGITQGAVSQQISRLEATLKLQLISRDGRTLRLMPAGVNLRYHARRVIEELRECERSMRNFNRVHFPNLSVGVLDTLGKTLIGTIVETLEPVAEQIQVRASITYRHKEDLLSGDLDMVVSAQPFDPEEFEIHPIVSEPIILMVPKGLIADPAQLDLEKLSNTLPLIRFAHQRRLGRMTDQYLSRQSITTQRSIEVDQMMSVIESVKRAHGWAITTPFNLLDPTFDGNQIDLHGLPPPVPERTINLVTLPGRFVDLPHKLAMNCRNHLQHEITTRLSRVLPKALQPSIHA